MRVQKWREAGYPEVTGITKRLLAHWQAPETLHERRFFFYQLEAIETLIWLTEAPATAHGSIDIQGGSPHPSFLRKRLCKNPIFVSGHRQMMVWMVGLGSGFLFSQESSHVHGGIDIQGDGGGYECWCSKMATGSGKTLIMAMIIACRFYSQQMMKIITRNLISFRRP